jgi:DNA-binding HxlR family transcriptional regulator
MIEPDNKQDSIIDYDFVEECKKASVAYRDPSCFLIGCGFGSGKKFTRLTEEKDLWHKLCLEQTELAKKREEQLKSTRELLAILHGDGGHYTDEYGLEKSIQDAIELIHTKWILNEQMIDINQQSSKLNKTIELLKEADLMHEALIKTLNELAENGIVIKSFIDSSIAINAYSKAKLNFDLESFS